MFSNSKNMEVLLTLFLSQIQGITPSRLVWRKLPPFQPHPLQYPMWNSKMSLYSNTSFCHESSTFKFSLYLYINHEIYTIIDTNERWQQKYERKVHPTYRNHSTPSYPSRCLCLILQSEGVTLCTKHCNNTLGHNSPKCWTKSQRSL